MPLSHLRSNRFAIWLICAVMIMAALAPVVSRSLAWASGAQWVELCSVAGIERVQIRDGAIVATAAERAGTEKLPGNVVFDHCPLCAISTWQQALPSAQAQGWPVLAQATVNVWPVYDLWVVPVRFLLAAPARGPPSRIAHIFPV